MIASLISTVTKASLNLIRIHFWWINSYHYRKNKTKCTRLSKVHGYFMIPFILLKKWWLRSFLLLSSYFCIGRREVGHPLLFPHFSPLKAVICRQVQSGGSARRRETMQEHSRWPVPVSEGRNIREDLQGLSVCTCCSSHTSWFPNAKEGDKNRWTCYCALDVHSLCFSNPKTKQKK